MLLGFHLSLLREQHLTNKHPWFSKGYQNVTRFLKCDQQECTLLGIHFLLTEYVLCPLGHG